MLRRLLVGSAQYILGPFGPDCDLRRWGLRIAERGGGKRQEASGGCGGAQALVSTAQFVDQRSGLRTDPFGGESDGFIEALIEHPKTE